MSATNMYLSKSRFVSGCQCHRKLWWQVHEPDAPELVPDAVLKDRFAIGRRVGEWARGAFPGGRLIAAPARDFRARIEETREALSAGASAIFEAAFMADDIFVSVDVLERRAGGFCLIEVKSSTRVKEEHVLDVAIQAHVVRRSGIPLERVELMHLEGSASSSQDPNSFVRVDVTQAVAAIASVETRAAAQLAMLGGDLPYVAVGDHCTTPWSCPFLERCWPARPEHHLSTLYRVQKNKLAEWEAAGWNTIRDLPEHTPLTKIQERQRRAVLEDRIVIESGLREALSTFTRPFAVLDFETVSTYGRQWTSGSASALPVQFSCHVVGTDGELTHAAWLADGPDDPRPVLAERVVAACSAARVVVAYNAPFEKRILRELAYNQRHLAEELNGVSARTVDLLPIVRDHIYHPAFHGSFSLKSVLPALVPDMSYEGLEVGRGDSASAELARLLFDGEGLSPEERDKLRCALDKYCAQDTLALVRLIERLEVMADSS